MAYRTYLSTRRAELPKRIDVLVLLLHILVIMSGRSNPYAIAKTRDGTKSGLQRFPPTGEGNMKKRVQPLVLVLHTGQEWAIQGVVVLVAG